MAARKSKKRCHDEFESGYRPKTFVYWSKESGLGKTWKAYHNHGKTCPVVISGTRLWVDLYEPGDTLVLDEFEGQLPFMYLKQLTDIYPFKMEIKGGIVYKTHSDVVICSNKDPLTWYKNMSACEQQQLCRRMEIHELSYNPVTDLVTDHFTGEQWAKFV